MGKKKLICTIYVLFILSVLLMAGAFILFYPERKYSENENRFLEKKPEISVETLMSGEYQNKLSEAAADQFPGRNLMISISTLVEKMEGHRDKGGVYLAGDGYYIEKVTDSDISYDQFAANLRYVQYFMEKQDGDKCVMLVPSSGIVMRDMLPAYAQMYDYSGMIDTTRVVVDSAKIVPVCSQLESVSSEEQVYYRTDHHWTIYGAYAGYTSLYNEIGKVAKTLDYFEPQLASGDFRGTLYSKALDFSAGYDELYSLGYDVAGGCTVVCDDMEMHGIYCEEKLDTKDKYGYFFGGNYGRVTIKTKSDSEKKLLVIKDSFANSLVPFMLEDYSEITMIDLRYYNEAVSESVASDYDTTIVVYEMNNFANDKNLIKLTK